jgi:hypothetical protein
MRMFSEPESWIGLRSERAVAGEFDVPTARDTAFRQPKADRAASLTLHEVRAVMRRTLATLLGR